MTSEQEEISVAWVRRLDELESAHRHLLIPNRRDATMKGDMR